MSDPNVLFLVAAVVSGCVVLLFLLSLFFTYRLLRWLWRRLPSKLLAMQPAELDKALAILVSLALFPSLTSYAWRIFRGLIGFIPELMQYIGTFPMPSACRDENPSCYGELTNGITQMAAGLATRFVTVLDLGSFPAVSFVWFLISAIILTQLIMFVHESLVTRSVYGWSVAISGRISIPLRQRVIFALLIVVSFYLGLTALLAIPLFLDKSRAEQLTQESLVASLNSDSLGQEAFNKQFPETLAVGGPLPDDFTHMPKAAPDADQAASLNMANYIDQQLAWQTKQSKTLSDKVVQAWVVLRTSIRSRQDGARDRVKYMFASGLGTGSGRRQTAKHYYDLLSWHQAYLQQTQDYLRRCANSSLQFATVNNQQLQTMAMQFRSILRDVPGFSQSQLSGTSVPGFYDRVNQTTREVPQRIYETYDLSRSACEAPDDYAFLEPPTRPSLSEILGPVGAWTGWLLNTEQMPVVIIVGLVGFSLLGATVSRAVRSDGQTLSTGISLDDLIIVIASGTTAAVVVFLGAYGGLAVLGSAGGDPNPYIVFATCLIGAVYSEDVWTWARRRLLAQATTTTEPDTTAAHIDDLAKASARPPVAGEPGPPPP